MRILLATGIYPPDIGGPATYVAAFAAELKKRKHDVMVVTYGRAGSESRSRNADVSVVVVPKHGGVFSCWMRYRTAIRAHGVDADVIIAFTAVSAGIPLLLSCLRTPKKILRLGGEFFWERATDGGSMQNLRAWHRSWYGFWRMVNTLFMEGILTSFDGIVYSTAFQRDIHHDVYRALPPTTVIENAVPEVSRMRHTLHDPLRLLFMGRFVHFKNIPILIEAVSKMEDSTLTLVGDGPMKKRLEHHVEMLGIQDRVTFLPPIHGSAKEKVFADHDLLVIPSVTEISPNVALEARASGLPVLLTEETGLSDALSQGMLRAQMPDSHALLAALMKARSRYDTLAAAAPAHRTWAEVTDVWQTFLSDL